MMGMANGWIARMRQLSFVCSVAGLVLVVASPSVVPQTRAAGLPHVEMTGARGAVYLNASVADQGVMPTRFSPENMIEIGEEADTYVYLMDNYVRHIQWTSWGGVTAMGTGQVSLLRDDGSTSPVTITLGGLRRCAGQMTYTKYSLALAAGTPAPKLWPKGSTGTFPCVVALADQYRGETQGRRANCIPGLTAGGGVVAGWNPRPPGKWWFLCEMKFKSWGKATAVGRGTARLRSHVSQRKTEWAARIEFSRPMWCPTAAGGPGATTYGTVRLVLRGGQLPGKRHARRYTQQLKSSPSHCRLRFTPLPEKDEWGHIYR